jgi:CheY-like chemotaxis protein
LVPVIAAEQEIPDKKLILVIEDEQGVIELYHRYLIDDGFQIVSATKGCEGIDLAVALADQLHAITVDIIMPDMDGWNIIHALRQDPRTTQIPIIVCSIVQDHSPAKALGVNRCLVKPILQRDLLEALAEYEPTSA